MASSTNRFGLVLLILVASTTFFPGKAQADYWSCMYNCHAGYLLCCQYCFSESIGMKGHPKSDEMKFSCRWSKQRGTFETLRTTTIGARWGEASVTFTSETLQKLEASNRNTSNMLTIKSTETMVSLISGVLSLFYLVSPLFTQSKYPIGYGCNVRALKYRGQS
ncbi:uncharacterized protein LOC113319281 [Papaver somniferum]|uniref:uncharacterized protein LOC113319281 n=1 Tax=Papaver somniferum TaxID=3469 RepID=UPI000E7048D6|nr:uncharacterized protein LOC113319281 [Papaver somniferum]